MLTTISGVNVFYPSPHPFSIKEKELVILFLFFFFQGWGGLVLVFKGNSLLQRGDFSEDPSVEGLTFRDPVDSNFFLSA